MPFPAFKWQRQVDFCRFKPGILSKNTTKSPWSNIQEVILYFIVFMFRIFHIKKFNYLHILELTKISLRSNGHRWLDKANQRTEVTVPTFSLRSHTWADLIQDCGNANKWRDAWACLRSTEGFTITKPPQAICHMHRLSQQIWKGRLLITPKTSLAAS